MICSGLVPYSMCLQGRISVKLMVSMYVYVEVMQFFFFSFNCFYQGCLNEMDEP